MLAGRPAGQRDSLFSKAAGAGVTTAGDASDAVRPAGRRSALSDLGRRQESGDGERRGDAGEAPAIQCRNRVWWRCCNSCERCIRTDKGEQTGDRN